MLMFHCRRRQLRCRRMLDNTPFIRYATLLFACFSPPAFFFRFTYAAYFAAALPCRRFLSRGRRFPLLSLLLMPLRCCFSWRFLAEAVADAMMLLLATRDGDTLPPLRRFMRQLLPLLMPI